MAYDIYPYTNLHELNLDWILQEMKRVSAESASTKEAQAELKEFVEQHIDEIPAEVARQLQEMADSGELVELLGGSIVTQLTNRKGRRWLFIGDSYANRPDDWDNTIVDRWNLSRADLTAGDTYTDSTDCFMIRWGGYGFLGIETSDPDIGGKWIDLCDEYWPSDIDKNSITDIVIVGGYNDRLQSYDDLTAAIRQFNALFTSTFVNAQVWLAEVGADVSNRLNMQRLRTVYEAYKDQSNALKNWRYIAGSEGVLHFVKSNTETDFHHPTPEGGKMLGAYIAAALQGAPLPSSVKTDLYATPASNDITIIAGRRGYYTYYDPSTMRTGICFGDNMIASGTIAIDETDNSYPICVLPDTAVFGTTAGRAPYFPVHMRYQSGGVTTVDVFMSLVYVERNSTTNVHTLKVKPLVALPEGARLIYALLPHTIDVNIFPIVDPEI